jgi:PleD family two-component response regulator
MRTKPKRLLKSTYANVGGKSQTSLQRACGITIGNVFSFRDVTAAKRAEVNLRHCASHDPLPGLPHRALLFNRISQVTAQARRHRKKLALLFIDVDQIKRVNII